MAILREPTPEECDQLIDDLLSSPRRLPIEEQLTAELAVRSKIMEASRGEMLFEQGAQPDYLFFVMSGQLRASDTRFNPPHTLSHHTQNTFVGEQGMLNNRPRTATVDVIADTRLACWDRADFEWLMEQAPRVRRHLEEIFAERVRRSARVFPGQQWDEAVVVHSRKHALRLVRALLVPLLVFLASLIMLLSLPAQDGSRNSWLNVIRWLFFLPTVFGFLWSVYRVFDWWDDEYIVTSKRVIHIERFVFHAGEWNEAPLIRIQDVSVVANNWIQRLLNDSDLIVQTAGRGIITFAGIPRSERVYEAIFSERAKALEREDASDLATVRHVLAEQLGGGSNRTNHAGKERGEKMESQTQTQRKKSSILNYLWPRTWTVDGETITWRKHWIILLRKVWLAALSTFFWLMILAVSLIKLVFTGEAKSIFGPGWWLAVVLPLMGLVISFIWYLYQYDDWHKDVYIVTRDRLIDVESSSFRLRGERSTVGTFDVIQNITYSVPSFMHKIINMGSVVIETAGKEKTFTFINVLNPSGIQQEIFNRWVALQERRQQRSREQQARNLATWISDYQTMRDEPTQERS